MGKEKLCPAFEGEIRWLDIKYDCGGEWKTEKRKSGQQEEKLVPSQLPYLIMMEAKSKSQRFKKKKRRGMKRNE